MKSVTVASCCEAKRGLKHQKDYEAMAVRLAKSIRNNGGIYKDCDIVFWSDKDYKPSEETIKKLKDYGCELVYGKTPIEGHPISNKIAACSLPFDTDYVIWMDTDLYVLRDFSELLKEETDIVVSPDTRVGHPWTREEDTPLWDRYYEYFDLKNPNIKILTHQDKKLGNFYFCSGLIVFRNAIDFGKKYLEIAKSILSTDVENRVYAFSQTSLPVVIVKYGLTYSLIPERLHYFYSIHGHKLDYSDIAIVHYQDRRIDEVLDEDWVV